MYIHFSVRITAQYRRTWPRNLHNHEMSTIVRVSFKVRVEFRVFFCPPCEEQCEIMPPFPSEGYALVDSTNVPMAMTHPVILPFMVNLFFGTTWLVRYVVPT